MAEHDATYINKVPKGAYQYNESRRITVVTTSDGKLKVTSPGSAPHVDPIYYDTNEDFNKDWKIIKTYGYNIMHD